jgi:tRNA threonylcarbamoyladenosine biosynthesis protein TsaB
MKMLAIEFSSAQRSVAAVADGQVRGRAEQTGGRNTRAIGLVERALGDAGMEREAIECIAVSLGPGSYAGIRGAIALAQGWQLARGVRLLGVSSVECLAAQAQAERIKGRVNILIDAQRNEFYFAAYELDAHGRREVEPLRLVSRDEAQARCGRGPTVLVPEPLAGFPHARVWPPDAGMLGQLAAARSDFVPGDKLEPIYLRETAFVKAPPLRGIAEMTIRR